MTKDRSIKAVIERLRFGDSDGDDHDIAAGEIERLRNDIQELTCGDPRKVCPNCRGESEPKPPQVGDTVTLHGLASIPDGTPAVCTATSEPKSERMDEFVEWIEKWANAYPLNVFPEPDMHKARDALRAGGVSLDQVSASNMRHVITQVRDELRLALNREGN